MRCRLDVVARSVVDAVTLAGGYMFDCSLAGWRVRVCTADGSDLQALTILGAHLSEESVATTGPYRQPVVVLADRPAGGSGSDQGPHPVQHRLSTAAKAFKAQALRSLGIDIDVEDWETIWLGLGGSSDGARLAGAGLMGGWSGG